MKNDTNNKICCFVQARLSSTRLYSKVLKKINNSTFLDLIYSKCKDKTYDLVFLIPSNEKELALQFFLQKKKIRYFAGSYKNVLKRFYEANQTLKYKTIVRLTADNIFLDRIFIKNNLRKYFKLSNENVLYSTRKNFPKGITMEIFSSKMLEESFNKSINNYEKEHVTPYMYDNYMVVYARNKFYKKFSNLNCSIDTKTEYNKIRNFAKSVDFLNLNTYNLVKKFYEFQ